MQQNQYSRLKSDRTIAHAFYFFFRFVVFAVSKIRPFNVWNSRIAKVNFPNVEKLYVWIMRVIAKSTLRTFWVKHIKAQQSLLAWHNHFSKHQYNNANEIIAIFRSADTVGTGRIVFNICRNDYRLIVKFDYTFQFAFIRFVGAHKEYDKIKDI